MNIKEIFDNGILPFYLFLFQIAFTIFLGVFGDYNIGNVKSNATEVPEIYAMWMDVHTMMFIGFGFLMTFLKKYGYGSVGFNFILAAYVLEWALLCRGWIEQGIENINGTFSITIENLLVADFCAAAVLISFGAVLGKLTLSQLIAMATFEVIVQTVNEYIGIHYLMGYDVGESIYVHIFGAYFGLTVSKVMHHKTVESSDESSNYHSDLFAMIGSIFLWIYWPSFNAATAVDEGQIRAIVNTYIAITASCITTFMVSSLFNKGKFNMVHIQNATLSGGVAIGAVADMAIKPFGAVIIGSATGVISTLGYQYLLHFLNKYLKLHDTCGVNNLHGIPGLISGFCSIIVAATATRDNFNGDRLYVFYPSRIPTVNSTDYLNFNLNATEFKMGGLGRSAGTQAAFQLAAIATTLGMAIVSGIFTGIFLRLPFFNQIRDEDEMFTDKSNWILPEDFDLSREQAF